MFTWIISSSVLIVTILAIRLIFKGKISMRLQYALWAIVLVRLLFPGSIMESSFSVMNAVEVTESKEYTDENENFIGLGTLLDQSVTQHDNNNSDVQSQMPEMGNQSVSNTETETNPNGTTGENQNQGVSDVGNVGVGNANSESSAVEDSTTTNTSSVNSNVQGDAEKEPISAEMIMQQFKTFAPTLWIGGMLALGLCFLFSNVYFGNRLKKNRVLLFRKEDAHLPVYSTSLVETPCLSGFFRPAVYLTKEVLEDADMMEHVLAHEETHYRHKDHVWSILRCVCLIVHWYNPLVWFAAMMSKQDAELACDEGTIARLGEDKRAAYGRTVIGLTYMKPKPEALLLTATSMSGSKSSIKERVTMIAKKPKMAVYILIVVLLISVVAVGCTFTGAKVGSRAGEEQKQEIENQDTEQTDENEEDSTGDTQSGGQTSSSGQKEDVQNSGTEETTNGSTEEEYVVQQLPDWCPYDEMDVMYETAMWLETIFADASAYFADYNGDTIHRIPFGSAFTGAATRGDIVYYHTESTDLQAIINVMADAMIEPLMEKSEVGYTITAYKFKEHKVHQVSDNVWLIDYINGYYKYTGTDLVDMESYAESEGFLMDEEGYMPFQRQGSGGTFIYVLVREGEKYRLQRLDDMYELMQSDYQEIRGIWDTYFDEKVSGLEFYNHGTLISYNPETREAVFNIQKWIVVSPEEDPNEEYPSGYRLEEIGEQTFILDEGCETWVFVKGSSYFERGLINLEQLPTMVDAGFEGGYMPLLVIYLKDGKIAFLQQQYQP